jgi:DNA-binding MarR family transcriptional regulator
MVVTIDALERAGLVERRTSSSDRRARVIAVTAAGRGKVEEGEAIVAEVQADVLGALPAPHRESLMAALQMLVGDRLCTTAECSHPVRRRRSIAAA